MKKGLLPFAAIALILFFSMWCSASMTSHTMRWQTQLRHARILAQNSRWSDVQETLSTSYDDWSDKQTFLHIVTEHDAVDDAEAMYHRALAFAAEQESSEFQAEIADLLSQLQLLSEMEQFTVKNVL